MGYKSENHDDMALFKNRLWKLMEKKGIFSANELARQLCRANLVKVKIKDEELYLDENEVMRKEVDSTVRKIQTHLKSDDTAKLQGEFVTAYCTFFGCSADYLFGNIECTTKEKQICQDLTGLSEDAIEILEKDKNSPFPYALTAINFLLKKDNFLDDKRELLNLILQYILLSQNIKSYDECGVSKVESKEISLCDEYGNAAGSVPIDKMSNIFLLSINEILSKLKNNISETQMRKKPTVYKILDDMLFDVIRMQDIYENIDGFNFDIDELSVMNRRFEENRKRLVCLFHCRNINDIDFKGFLKEYPQYNSRQIDLLKERLYFY